MMIEDSLDETERVWMGLRRSRQDTDNGLQESTFPQIEVVKTQKGTILSGKIVENWQGLKKFLLKEDIQTIPT